MRIELDRNLNFKDHFNKIEEELKGFKKFIKKLNSKKILIITR